MESRGVRDKIVLATKFTTHFRRYRNEGIQPTYFGNNTKSMRLSVEASLKKLKTDYIDLVRSFCPLRQASRANSKLLT
jgi:aryl-alcohol dehydrogenase-like predicted oxidoreductase